MSGIDFAGSDFSPGLLCELVLKDEFRLHSLCITWGGKRIFWGDTKIFRKKLGGLGNFQLIYRGGCQISP